MFRETGADTESAPGHVVESARKKGGRPTGSKNMPKRTPQPRRKRKDPSEIVDTRTAIAGAVSDLDILIKNHNAKHNTNLPPVVSPFVAPIVERNVDRKFVLQALSTVSETVGAIAHIESRPSPESLDACADSWVQLLSLAPPVSPLTEAILGVVITTAVASSPMIFEATGILKLSNDIADDIAGDTDGPTEQDV